MQEQNSQPSSLGKKMEHGLLEAERRIHERLEWLHILNDFVAAVLFLAGSILFLWESTQTSATWLFIIGSAVFLNGPVLRVLNKRYVKHYHKDPIHW